MLLAARLACRAARGNGKRELCGQADARPGPLLLLAGSPEQQARRGRTNVVDGDGRLRVALQDRVQDFQLVWLAGRL